MIVRSNKRDSDILKRTYDYAYRVGFNDASFGEDEGIPMDYETIDEILFKLWSGNEGGHIHNFFTTSIAQNGSQLVMVNSKCKCGETKTEWKAGKLIKIKAHK